MMHSSPSVTTPVSAEPSSAPGLLQPIAEFLIRRRILLSAILFTLLIVSDVLFGSKPRDPLGFHDPLGAAGSLLVLGGLALRSWSAGILRKDAELTMTGPYRLIRNPLYVGSFLMMFGFCVLIDDPKNIWLILGPMLVIYIVKVRGEERLLSTRFSAQWPDYARRTPRFIPRIARASLRADWRAAQWMHSREYQALGATLSALVAIKIWHLI
jgi:protein-S-isoprenylcysteine O-methyltransferase Ste14